MRAEKPARIALALLQRDRGRGSGLAHEPSSCFRETRRGPLRARARNRSGSCPAAARQEPRPPEFAHHPQFNEAAHGSPYTDEERRRLADLFQDLTTGPGRGCLLVTCRPGDTALPGAQRQELHGLARPDSLWLLHRILERDGLTLSDPRLTKDIPLRGDMHLQLIAEAFNLTNKSNVSNLRNTAYTYNIGTNVFTPASSDPLTGYLSPSAVAGPRTYQFAAKFLF